MKILLCLNSCGKTGGLRTFSVTFVLGCEFGDFPYVSVMICEFYSTLRLVLKLRLLEFKVAYTLNTSCGENHELIL